MDFPIPIDIPLPAALTRRLTPPKCEDIKLKEPTKLDLCSPFGGAKFQGIVDVSKGIPDDCALTFSILLQLPPFMVSMGCFIKVLKLMGPLLKFVQAVPNLPTKPGDVVSAVGELVPAVEDLVKCLVSLQMGVPAFVKDLIILIAKLLKCIGEQLKSLAALMDNLQISIKAAGDQGNKALAEQLNCANDNAKAQAMAALGSVDIITVILSMAEPLMALAPGPKIEIPSFGSAESAFELEQTANTMISVASSLEQIASAIPGC